ncbi:MAG: helix-turn-helix domain-containing protein [Marinicella sp.]
MAFTQAVMMVAIVIKNSEPKQPGRLLALLLSVMAYKLLEGGLINSDLYQYVPHLIDWMAGVALLIGPIFYAYVLRMAGHSPWRGRVWLFNLSPFLLLLLIQLPGLWIPAAQKIAQIEFYKSHPGYSQLPWFFILLLVIIKVHLASYLWQSWQVLSEAEVAAEQQTADDASWCLSWQKKLCLMLIALEVLWAVLFIGQQFLGLSALNAIGEYWLLLMAAVVLMMGYWGLQKPQLILEAHSEPNDLAQPNQTNQSEKYQNSLIDDSTAGMIAREINQAMKQDELYLESTLNLSMLSKHLGIRRHLISQVITQTLNTTFFKLINTYRVAHAKTLIADDRSEFTLERIAVESGFNNRVTFNKAFKEAEGHSPSIYRKTLKLAS